MTRIIAAALLALALPAAAAEPFAPDPGCDGVLTAEMSDCRVHHALACAKTGLWQLLTLDPGGRAVLHSVDGAGLTAAVALVVDGVRQDFDLAADWPAEPFDGNALQRSGRGAAAYLVEAEDGAYRQSAAQYRVIRTDVVLAGARATVLRAEETLRQGAHSYDTTAIERHGEMLLIDGMALPLWTDLDERRDGGAWQSQQRRLVSLRRAGDAGFLTLTPDACAEARR